MRSINTKIGPMNLYLLEVDILGPNVSTTPLQQWGFWQCLPFSWTTLKRKHCKYPIAVMGDENTFRLDCLLP